MTTDGTGKRGNMGCEEFTSKDASCDGVGADQSVLVFFGALKQFTLRLSSRARLRFAMNKGTQDGRPGKAASSLPGIATG
jgi:hypothetical protein